MVVGQSTTDPIENQKQNSEASRYYIFLMEDFCEDIQLENLSHVFVESAVRKMEDFPEDIQWKILSGVPGESVLNCKLVCKKWQQLLSNRKVSLGIYFSISSFRPIIQHYYASYDIIKSTKPEEEDFCETKITKISLPPLKEEGAGHDVIVDSCNGLICLAIPYKGSYGDHVYICNPYTSEYTVLPRVSTIKYWVGNIVSGFGYLPSTDEYKVVRILYPYKGYRRPASEDDKILVQVYTLGKNSSSGWRNITSVPPGLLHREGTFANGPLYWKYIINNMLIAFDLVDESFQVLPTPPCIQFPREEEQIMQTMIQ
ncbi:F-box protein At3g07870-like [Papaver somniferum]|uniref:F-box protein At3g07870-like n=1 Tax=Papaver somniferum TaxID=3469 RepID=UPI000E6F7965|nr:F-box protein At3g07870-like [Papaver somniferum]